MSSNEKTTTWINHGQGVLQHSENKRFYHRPKINGKFTYRSLGKLMNLTQARKAKQTIDAQQTMSEIGVKGVEDPFAEKSSLVGQLMTGYEADGCPKVEDEKPREGKQLKMEKERLNRLRLFWGERPVDSIVTDDCSVYNRWRKETITREGCDGSRSVDMELFTLYAVLAWAKSQKKIGEEPLRQLERRKRFQLSKYVVHCREKQSRNEDEFCGMARRLFEGRQLSTEALGWQHLLEGMTGCRTSEILACRWDAKDERYSGFRTDEHLYLSSRHGRLKDGINPWVSIHPALAETLKAMEAWRVLRGHNTENAPWFIPGRDPRHPAAPGSLTAALSTICEEICGEGEVRNSHGNRAYYVYVRRSEGAFDEQIADELGQSSGAAIIVSTYGKTPPNWRGGKNVTWLTEERPWAVLDLPLNVTAIPKEAVG